MKIYATYFRYKFAADRIYNIDETGFTTVQQPKKVVTVLGIKQVGSCTSGERGELVTVLGGISASGNSIPPHFVLPRAKVHDHFLHDAPAGSIMASGKSEQGKEKGRISGWINAKIFSDIYLPHFIKHAIASKERPVLLIMDNHESHLSIDAIELAKTSGVVMLTLPPHTSHKLQPLNRTVYGPLKTYYNRAMDDLMRTNPGKRVQVYNIPSLVGRAYHQGMTHGNIVSGFRCTGIYPLNRFIPRI